MTINAIDILLVLLVLLSVWHGWRRGFICGSFDLLRWIASLIAGLRFYRPVARWFGPHLNLWSDAWDRPVAFLLVAIITGTTIYLVGYAILRRLPKDLHRRKINQIFGLATGLANGLIGAAILAALLLAVPLNQSLRESASNSVLANYLAGYTESVEAELSPVFEGAIAETLNLLTIKPESNERVSLPYTVAESRPRPSLEVQMLELINKERRTAGVAPLSTDPELTPVARQHSADMFRRGYFSHVSPENRSAFDRMRQADVRFLAAGENLALAPSVQIAHMGLMKSPGHRANILRPEFRRVGIGIMDGGIRGLMVTQNFRN